MVSKHVKFNDNKFNIKTLKYERTGEYNHDMKDWCTSRRIIKVYFLEELLRELWNNNLITRDRLRSMFYKKTEWEYDLIDFEEFFERAITLIRIALYDESDDPDYIITTRWTGFRIENLLSNIY